MDRYLAATDVIDWHHPRIVERASALAETCTDPHQLAQRCFEWVRDAIAHSMDCGAKTLTCRASDVLRAGHGVCFAKSHLLAALLRANGIPAGFDYQRLREGERFMLHGLNTLYLPDVGWYRVDARGNKPGVDARFAPPREYLAWPVLQPGELDYRLNLAEPLSEVVIALGGSGSPVEACAAIPASVRMG